MNGGGRVERKPKITIGEARVSSLSLGESVRWIEVRHTHNRTTNSIVSSSSPARFPFFPQTSTP